MKHFKASVLAIDMKNDELFLCQVTNGDCLHFPKSHLLSMAKLDFLTILAQYHCHKRPVKGYQMFRGLSACDSHDKKSITSMSIHSRGLLTPLQNHTAFFLWQKWQNWVLGKLLLCIQSKSLWRPLL